MKQHQWAVAVFVVQGAVLWKAALPMLLGAWAGGFAGGRLTRSLPGSVVRAVVIATGSCMTGLHTWRYWL